VSVTEAPPERLVAEQQPRTLRVTHSFGDRVFRAICTGAAAVSLLIIAGTALFLAGKSIPALKAAGVKDFFTSSAWESSTNNFGVFGLVVNTVIIAVIALFLAVPFALGLALFVNEYIPHRLRRPLVSAVDLLAALPSLIFGMWGLYALQGPLVGVARWLTTHLDAIPFFRLTSPDVQLSQSSFVVGVVVAIMVTPIITSVSRDVMAQCPRSQCEGALALGGSRWGMIRSVILPFGRAGIVGSVLLGFGRALGETIAVALIIMLVFQPQPFVLEQGGGSIASMIAVKFGEAGSIERSALIAAGLALFMVTLVVNLAARRIVARSRSAQ